MHKKTILSIACFSFLTSLNVYSNGLITYKPPKLDALNTSHVGGGTRAFGVPKILALAPKEVALTSTPQPTLYWYKPTLTAQEFKIVVMESGQTVPLLEKEVLVSESGLQQISLKDDNVNLQPSKIYEWSVSTRNHSENAEASISYQTVPFLQPIEQKAESGYWYDVLSQLIESNSPLKHELLKQIGVKVDF
jgi:hypothetical protein